MANEIYYSGLGDLRLAAVLHQEIALLLADRGSLRGQPAIVNYGDLSGRGSTVLEVPQAGLDGYDRMAAVAENASTSNTALTDASPSITIARQALQYQISDLANITDSVGLDTDRLAASMVGARQTLLSPMPARRSPSRARLSSTRSLTWRTSPIAWASTLTGLPPRWSDPMTCGSPR